MSRTLKFRVWDIPNQCWSDLFHVITEDGALWHFPNSGFAERDDPEQYTVEQYTGLKDKNGKEIYEGDVVRQVGSNLVCPVEFKYGGFVPFTSDMMTFDNDYCEVIGNIHENAELLGGEE